MLRVDSADGRQLMSIFDTDRSGSINFMEFEGLYRYIQDWHGIFGRFDQDQSGLIDRRELHDALEGFGFSLPSDMVRKLEKRFAPPPKAGGNQNTGISFDRFLMACVTVKHYTEAFRNFDPKGTGRATLDYNSYVSGLTDWTGLDWTLVVGVAGAMRCDAMLTGADGHHAGRAVVVDLCESVRESVCG